MSLRRVLAAAAFTAIATAPWYARVADAADERIVVARVGDAEITAAELERRLRAMPPHQLRSFGDTPEAIRKNYLERVLVRDALWAKAAEERKLASDPRVERKRKGLLQQALLQQVEDEALRKNPITEEDVRAYYEKNRSRFVTPERIQIWRIRVAKKDAAEAILKKVRGKDGVTEWKKIAREQSLDDATKLRGGNLGFVRPDGQTNVPRVRVDKVLFEAASKVKDGELVPEPVAEGKYWAVVWRRGSMAGVTRTLEQESSAIERVLRRERAQSAREQLVADLRKKHVKDVNVKLLDYIKVTKTGFVESRKKPGVVPRGAPGAGTPKKTERGLR